MPRGSLVPSIVLPLDVTGVPINLHKNTRLINRNIVKKKKEFLYVSWDAVAIVVVVVVERERERDIEGIRNVKDCLVK